MYKLVQSGHKGVLVFISVIALLFIAAYSDHANGADFKSEDELLDETRANVEKHLNDKWQASSPVIKEKQAPEIAAEAPKAAVREYSEEIIAANFDSGKKPSNLGGNFGAWNKNLSDTAQWCKKDFDNVTKHGDAGFAMKLDYSVDSPNPTSNGFWMALRNLDVSKYDNLAFWLKGDAKAGYTTVFKVELRNAGKQTGRCYVTSVTDQWQEAVMPLSEFKGLTDTSNLTDFVIVFEDKMASNKRGVIYIDDIRFTKNK